MIQERNIVWNSRIKLCSYLNRKGFDYLFDGGGVFIFKFVFLLKSIFFFIKKILVFKYYYR